MGGCVQPDDWGREGTAGAHRQVGSVPHPATAQTRKDRTRHLAGSVPNANLSFVAGLGGCLCLATSQDGDAHLVFAILGFMGLVLTTVLGVVLGSDWEDRQRVQRVLRRAGAPAFFICVSLTFLYLAYRAHRSGAVPAELLPCSVWIDVCLLVAGVTAVISAFHLLCPDISHHETSASVKPADESGRGKTDETGRAENVDPDTAEILAALEHRNHSRWRWGRAFWLLVVSIVLFVVLGRFGWGLEATVTLAIIILVHELGHLLAMLCLGYRNLHIFLIPMFGGAASGHNPNAAGWKDGVVALAGPLPSLLLGYLLLFVAIADDNHMLLLAAAATIAINALNLLPVFPLDGGRVILTTLLARSPYTEVIGLLLSAGTLAGLAVVLSFWPLALLGLLPLVSIPHSLREGAMARALKDQIDAPASGQGVPPEAAIHILEHARRQNRIASQANPRIAAALIDSVWKRIVGRSPGAGGTVALLGAYGSAVASVIVVPLVAIALIEMGVLPPPSSRLFELVHPDFRTKTQLRQELGESQLWQAAWTDDSRRIEQLVEQGVDINTTSAAFGGMNALMIAAREGSCKALQTLITHRAKLDLRDEKGRTALHFAVEGGLPEAVEVLLEAGANPATHDGEESDLLRLAIRQRNSRTLRVLVNAGADVHGVDDAGQSVIAFAAQHGSARCVKILLQAGADPSVECHKRKDALAYAVARPGHDPDRFAVVRLLWRHVRTHQQDINQTER